MSKKSVIVLHGLGGEPSPDRKQVLESLGWSVIYPHIDYEVEWDKDKGKSLFESMCRQKFNLIIGISLGGYMGYHLSKKLGVDAILINPALDRSVTKTKISDFDIEYTPVKSNIEVFSGMDDTTVPTELIVNYLDKNDTEIEVNRVIGLEHRLPIRYFRYILNNSKIFNQNINESMRVYQDKELINTPGFKKFYFDAFELFKKHYPDRYTEFKFDNGKTFRVIWRDKDHKIRSIFNKLGTNYTAYAALINLALKKLDSDVDPRTEEGYKFIMDYLKSNKDFFQSLLFEIGKKIEKTTALGDASEDNAVKALKMVFGDSVLITKTAGLGEIEDAVHGCDLVMIRNTTKYKIQVKSISNINLSLGKYYVSYKNPKLYRNIDYFVFSIKGYYYVFTNVGIEILTDQTGPIGYICPDSSRIGRVKV